MNHYARIILACLCLVGSQLAPHLWAEKALAAIAAVFFVTGMYYLIKELKNGTH